MTGYGRGEHTQEGYKITAEVSTVNRKQAEINVYLPRELEPLDSRVRAEINRRVARGRVTARITLHVTESALISHAQVNMALARAYARELRKRATSWWTNATPRAWSPRSRPCSILPRHPIAWRI